MKNILCFSLFCLIAANARAQSCQNVFIWPFQMSSGENPELAVQLTLDMEAVFLEHNCTVFTSGDLSNWAEKTASMPSLAVAEDIPATILNELPALSANKYLFGRIRLDNGKNAIVQFSLYSLPDRSLLGIKKLMFSELELRKEELRKGKLIRILEFFPESAAQPEATAPAPSENEMPPPDPVEENETEAEQPQPRIVIQAPDISINRTKTTPQPAETGNKKNQGDKNTVRKKPKPDKTVAPAPKPVSYYEVTFIVAKKVDRLSVTGYNNLKLTNRKDGRREASLKLKQGNYELKVYQDGALKCNKPFYVRGKMTIESPCR